MTLDTNFAESVIEHMNSDHQEACRDIVRAHSTHKTAAKAVMTNIDCDKMEFDVWETTESATNSAASSSKVTVFFYKPLRDASQVRGMLVGMTQKARQGV